MPLSTSKKLTLLLLVLAGTMLFDALLRPLTGAAATSQRRNDSVTASHDAKAIRLRRGVIDTSARRDLDTAAQDHRSIAPELAAAGDDAPSELRLVQFAGPIKQKWYDQLKATGAEIVSYIPNYAYLIRATSDVRNRVALLDAGEMADDAQPIRWMGRLDALNKIDPAFSAESLTAQATANADVEIELLDGANVQSTVARIDASAGSTIQAPRRFLKFVVLTVNLPVSQLLDIARSSDVLFIGPSQPFKPQDEVSAQIVAGNLTADGIQPAAPGYLEWLASKGLNTVPDYTVNVSDTGLDQGKTTDLQVHPDLLDADGHSRVSYSLNYANDSQTDDRLGHGTLVTSVVAGLGSSDRQDGNGYRYGTGVDPMARIGMSRVFDQLDKMSSFLDHTDVASNAYQRGARISNSSWGNGSNLYDATGQEYDALTRDAQPGTEGNQEMLFVFSAGNAGPGGHISSPGTAKNVISVAASENFRPSGTDSCNIDGQGDIGPDGADNALDILRYSSGGPTLDGRNKPDIAAPGTHVYGAASRSSSFNGFGLCPGIPIFQPPGQRFYTWSSGTSLAAPHIAGAASLVRRFFTGRNLLGDSRPPSPAMIKAFLLNSTTYMTGANAGGDIPAPRQGYGRANLSHAFDDTARQFVDQSVLFTESGQTYETTGSIADRSQPLRVTLVWTDAVGSLIGPALVNDLDLEVSIGDTVVYRGNHFEGAVSVEGGDADRLNNAESVIIPASAIPEGVAGNFKITVRAANIAGDGVPGNSNALDQDFALVVANIAAPLDQPPPPEKIPIVSFVTYVKKTITITGRQFTSAAQVEINGKAINQPFAFNAGANALSLKLKPKKLNMTVGTANQIVLIENGQRSLPYTLQL